jgi:hypothetical protein
MLSRTVGLRVLCAVACLAVLPATSASAAGKSKLPRITSVAPMKLGVGDVLTIRGANFRAGTGRNSVVFKRDGARAIFVKAGRSTKTSLKVRVPASLAKYLPSVNGRPGPARFRLRVLTASFSRGYTPIAKSPTIAPANATSPDGGAKVSGPAPGITPLAPAAPVTPAGPPDCDGDGTPDATDGDDDNDLLTDALEAAIKTAPCSADSDGDGLSDAFEYQSAIDLNNTGGSLPYPGKRPYPNPLFADEATDYDGDGLSAAQEHALWRYVGPPALPLAYSAGLRRTVPGPVDDDYRDADVDGLGNWDEFNGPMTPRWWAAYFKTERPYTEPYAGTSAIDSDSDGDGLLDGADDQDHDLWTNADELYRSTYRVQPFNPCLPDYDSPTCSNHPPIDDPYPPFDKPNQPLPASPILWVPPPPAP